ncbi:hypothetical protein JCM11491_004180 [Sporobolomyces phaffii]
MIPRIPRLLSRRRPPNVVWLVVALWARFTASQLVQPLAVPYSSSFDVVSGQTSYFHLGPTADDFLYLTLSLCSPPDDIADSPLPSHLGTTLYVSTDPGNQLPGPDNLPSKAVDLGATSKLVFGSANVTLEGNPDGVWVGVAAPDDSEYGGTGTGSWTFELDVTNDTPLVLLDGGASFDFQDSDSSTALLMTANWTDGQPQPSSYQPSYYPIISPATPLSQSLGRSRCFVQSRRAIPARNINTSTTTRGYGSGQRAQFLVSNLPPGQNYTAWLVQNLTEVSASTNATRLWDPIFFTTKTTSSCRLLYDLDFCPSVAYSVPAPLSLPTADLVSYFNSSISPSLTVFARTLTTFPCDSAKFGLYSIASTCTDCYEAYRDWLCATTIPRCTDSPSNVTFVSNSSLFDPVTDLATWSIPASYSTSLVRDYPPASRTPEFAPSNLSSTFPSLFNSSYPATRGNELEQSPFPYSEVPPCMDVCHLVDARCPPFLKWTCPTSGDTGRATYGMTQEIGSSGRVAGDVRDSSMTERAQDRWGNVYCNALQSDLKMAVQFVSLSPTSAAAPQTDVAAPALLSLCLVIIGVLWLH